MSAQLAKESLVVRQTTYDSKSMLDQHNFYAQGHASDPTMLSTRITHLLGRNRYPITMMAYADIAGKGTRQVIDTIEYQFPVIERTYRHDIVAETPASTTNVGKGHSFFKLRFKSNWFKRYYILQSERGVQARVIKDPVQIAKDLWEYELQLQAVRPDASLPVSEMTVGAKWIDLAAVVPFEYNDGTESKMVSPGKVKNQISYIRKSMQWAGMSGSKDLVMKYTMVTPEGKEINGWMDYFMYQFEQQWMEECEHMYWYSRYNRQSNGDIALVDALNGEVIPTGSGIIEQVPHYTTYTKLTYNKLQDMVANALTHIEDADNMTITLYTGRGGIREINRALREEGQAILGTGFGSGNVADKFIKGEGHNLMLDGFFSGFMHIDGYKVVVKYNPIFHSGRIADVSPRHPENPAFSLESYRFLFIDEGSYDGQSNIVHLEHKGRPLQQGYLAGFTEVPSALKVSFNLSGTGPLQMLSSAKDEGSFHRGKSMGVQIRRANKCFHAECIAGL